MLLHIRLHLVIAILHNVALTILNTTLKRNVKTPLHQKLHEQSILACFRLIPKNHPYKNIFKSKLQLRPLQEQLGTAAKY